MILDNQVNETDYLQVIGVGRFRILGAGGGARFKILEGAKWGGGGANSQQAHDIVLTSMRLNDDVISTSCTH